MRRVIDNERRAVNVCLHPLTHNTHTHTRMSVVPTPMSVKVKTVNSSQKLLGRLRRVR